MRLCVFGGTFDPIHHAHLFVAEDARAQFALDRVVFVPNGEPPHKSRGVQASAEDRFRMVQLAIEGNPAFAASRVEIDRVGPSYTVDTIRELRQEYPNAELFFLTGVDAVAEVQTWFQYEELLRLCRFIAATRPGYTLAMLRGRLPAAVLKRIEPLPSPYLAIASTDIRHRVRRGTPIRYLTPDSVADYIAAHGLYRPPCAPETHEE